MHAVAGTQAAQAAVPFAKVPTGQVVAVNAQEGAPDTLNAPAVEYLPAGQLVQEVAPLSLKVPAGHSEQDEAPEVEYEPAGQGNCVELVEPALQ